MDIKKRFNDNLSKMLFLELKKDHSLGEYRIKENIYIPVKAETIADRTNSGENMSEIPVSFFLEGMFYVLGADQNFRYNSIYKEIIETVTGSVDFIKNQIFHKVKDEKFEDAYILTKGLVNIEPSEEVFSKAFMLLENLRKEHKEYVDEELEIIDEAKKLSNYAEPYLYESLICREKTDFDRALALLHRYLELGGKETVEITEFKQNLININTYNIGKELAIDDPEEALKHLIPLVDYFGDSPNIYYYIALSYRVLGNFEKAIYYLNEAAAIDEAVIEVMNEYGINYASLGDFNKAVKYFEKAFEQFKSIEICTNIVMCYINLNDKENANKFLEEAEKIDKHDEIVVQLRQYFQDEK